LAEALDAWTIAAGDAKKAAELLEVTTTQLIRFTSRERSAWGLVQALRKEHNLAPLRI